MRLVVQTNVSGKLLLWLVQKDKTLVFISETVTWHGSDKALVLVNKLLRQNKHTVHDIQEILVVCGPGSFTAVRTGLIIANTLGQLLTIPVEGIVSEQELTERDIVRHHFGKKSLGVLVKPYYGKAPNITKAKPKKFQAKAIL